MTTRQIGLAVVLVALVAGSVFALWKLGFWTRPSEPTPEPTANQALPQEPVETFPVKLYFPGGDGRLYAELRESPAVGQTTDRIAAVLTQLLAGPQSSSLRPPLADGIQVAEVYLIGRQAVVDLALPDGQGPPALGSHREMLTVYSLVNSVVFNFTEAEQVILLWNGRQPETFAGHLDTTHPLRANSGLVAP